MQSNLKFCGAVAVCPALVRASSLGRRTGYVKALLRRRFIVNTASRLPARSALSICANQPVVEVVMGIEPAALV